MTTSIPPEETSQPPTPEITPEDFQPEPVRQPVRIHFPERQPVVTYVIIGITVLMFLAQLATEQFLGYDLPSAIAIKYNPLIDSGQFWRLITPVLLHGSFLHIAFNMYAVYILGREIERFYGHGRFLLLYLIGGFGGGVASYLLTPAPSLGASTATFGLLAAYGVFGYRNRHVFGKQGQRIVTNVLQVAVINFLLGLSPGIDNWGHLGGAIAGLALAWFSGPVLDVSGQPPDLYLRDKTPTNRFLAVFVAVAAVFALLAALLPGAA